MITVSGYGYKDLTNTNGGQYNQHPTGGSAANIWVKDFGFVQTSSQTRYVRGETMHMPVIADTVICLTPRIEFHNENGYFTNLYEFESRMTVSAGHDTVAHITNTGELKNEQWFQGGVSYTLSHSVFDNHIDKTIRINFHDRRPMVRILEPIVQDKNTNIEWISPKEVIVSGPGKKIRVTVVTGDFNFEKADQSDRFVFPFPAMKCYPLAIKVAAPENGFVQTVKYRLAVVD